MATRISGTPPAIELIKKLTAQFGPIIFFQSGGCCEGSGPMCMPANEFRKTPSDVKVGEVEGAVEKVGLRITTVRDSAGTLWYLRNGEILVVGNKSKKA